MLVLMLVVATTFRFCPLVKHSRCAGGAALPGLGYCQGSGMGQTHLWAQTRKDAPLPNLIENSQFT